MTGKLLLKLDTVKFIVANHTVISALNYVFLIKKKQFPLFIWLSMKWIFILIVVALSPHFWFQREHFPFLEEYRCSRSRTTFYYTIGWLIFMEDSPVKFKSSMDPLLQVLTSLSLSLYIYVCILHIANLYLKQDSALIVCMVTVLQCLILLILALNTCLFVSHS